MLLCYTTQNYIHNIILNNIIIQVFHDVGIPCDISSSVFFLTSKEIIKQDTYNYYNIRPVFKLHICDERQT